MTVFSFHTADNQDNSGLDIDIMLDTAQHMLYRYYALCWVTQQVSKLPNSDTRTVWSEANEKQTYLGDVLPMISLSMLPFNFHSDREHKFQLQI